MRRCALGLTELLDPVDFVGPQGRLLIDTSVFMDPDPRRRGGLGALLKRCGETIRLHHNPIVIPEDVVQELARQSRKVDPARTEAIRRAGVALEFIEDVRNLGLARTDIGHDSDHYADTVFDAIFTRYADTYDLCLLTNDITPLLHVRLRARSSGRKLVAGALTGDGRVEVDGDQALYERGVRKLRRKQAEGDAREVAWLGPLLADFRGEFGTSEPSSRPVQARPDRSRRPPAGGRRRVEPFDPQAPFRGEDVLIPVTDIPGQGDTVQVESAAGRRLLVLEELLGEGGEGSAFAVAGDRVVKIFGPGHVTQHRRAKIDLLVGRQIRSDGICTPEAVVTNGRGQFVGYLMPRARGIEFRVIMNPRRFRRTFPGWTKTDLVDVCISFLEKIVYLHSLNVIVGDINPKNLVVDPDKKVWLIDADSWQVDGYPCPVGTPMFTAASALHRRYGDSLRTIEEELFAVATMLFMVLITGQFPYARAGSDGDPAGLIKDGIFAFQVGDRSNRDQPEGNWKYMWSHMSRELKEMFWHTFHREGDRYASPPTADEWLRAFRQYRWWLGSDKNFDPMSNDVYPFRFKAFRPDTPIRDCPRCDREHAIVGDWVEATGSYTVPERCFDCRRESRSRCSDCRAFGPSGGLRNGRCRDCNRRREFGTCDRCGAQKPRRQLVDGCCSGCRPADCSTCGVQVVASELSGGRCASCELRGKELDPSRLCVDCGQPFIEFDHIAWFRRKGLEVAKSHTAVKGTCSLPAGTGPWTWSPAGGPGSAVPLAVPRSRRGIMDRLKSWWKA